ncbi:MAG: peptidoglycan-binding domain-containing protein, partial [Anaerolineae bacterium]|nr:peptidoglycan-binding domain-containing protein [Anaerolineae bacterium]
MDETSTALPAGSGRLHPPTDRVRFAQRVLNAVEGERLVVSGILGLRTRAALKRFRARYNLSTGHLLDEATVLALVQRALSQLGPTPLLITGVWDDATRQALSEFKQLGGLGAEPTLDAATLAALADA